MYCPNCGSKQADAAKFCTACGTRLPDMAVTPPVPEEPVQQEIPQRIQYAPSPYRAPAQQENVQSMPTQPLEVPQRIQYAPSPYRAPVQQENVQSMPTQPLGVVYEQPAAPVQPQPVSEPVPEGPGTEPVGRTMPLEPRPVPDTAPVDSLPEFQVPVRRYPPPPVTPKAKKKLPLIPVIAAAVVVVLILGAVLIFGGGSNNEVYLLVEKTDREDEWTYKYDSQGRLTDYNIQYGKRATVSNSFEYDEEGHVVQVTHQQESVYDVAWEIQIEYDKNGHPDAIEVDGYDVDVDCDKEGRITELKVEGNSDWEAEFDYHDNGILKQETCINGNKEYTYKYDKAGNQVYYESKERGELQQYSEYTYDEDGNLTMELHETYDEDGTKQESFTYTYDKDGRIQEITEIYDHDDFSYQLLFEVEESSDDEVVLEITDISGSDAFYDGGWDDEHSEDRITYRYNDLGQLVEVEYEGSTNRIITYKYKAFDVTKEYQKPFLFDPLFFIHYGFN